MEFEIQLNKKKSTPPIDTDSDAFLEESEGIFKSRIESANFLEKNIDNFLTINKYFPLNDGEKILNRCVEIAKSVQRTLSFINENLTDKSGKQTDTELFMRYSPRLYNNLDKFFNYIHYQSIKTEEALKILNDIELEQELLLSVLKAAKNNDIYINIEDITSMSFENHEIYDFQIAEKWLNDNKGKEQLDEERIKKYEEMIKDRNIMRKIYEQNYINNTELRDYLLKKFDEDFTSEYTPYKNNAERLYERKYNIMKLNGEIIAFNRIDVAENYQSCHFKQFNVVSNFKSHKIGNLMMKATVDKEAQNNRVINAESIGSSQACVFYIKNGFVAHKAKEFMGEIILDISRYDNNTPLLIQTMSEEDIMNKVNIPKDVIINEVYAQKDCDFGLLEYKGHPYLEEDKGGDSFLFTNNEEKRFILTKYFYNQNSGKWVTVFEPVDKMSDYWLHLHV